MYIYIYIYTYTLYFLPTICLSFSPLGDVLFKSVLTVCMSDLFVLALSTCLHLHLPCLCRTIFRCACLRLIHPPPSVLPLPFTFPFLQPGP